MGYTYIQSILNDGSIKNEVLFFMTSGMVVCNN